MPHRAHLQQPAQLCARGRRDPGDDLEQALRLLVDVFAIADVEMVVDHAQPDGVGVGLVPAEQLPGLPVIIVCAIALDLKVLAEEPGLELVVLGGRSEGYADDLLLVAKCVRTCVLLAGSR